MISYRLVDSALPVAAIDSLVGPAGTLVGLGLGALLLGWMSTASVAAVAPDIGLATLVASRTLLTAAGLGVLPVAAAPVPVLRRLRRMDIPATLRVVE